MRRLGRVGSLILLAAVAAIGGCLAVWKAASVRKANAVAASQPEPMESVTVAAAKEREHRRTTISIGTVVALRSITLRNELPGTVHEVHLAPGAIVEEGTLLVALDVSVEEAELRAQQAQAALAETLLARMEKALKNRAASETDVDRARAERDVALAQVDRTQAILARKKIRAPFRARVGISDVHPGQYLDEGTMLTTLQGVDEEANIDFIVPQQVAALLKEGDPVQVFASGETTPRPARIVAVDAKVDPATRNATARARIEGGPGSPAPGSSVRVRVPVGPPESAVSVPVTALRKGPDGDHVFVIEPDAHGKQRAHVRRVESGPVLGDEVVIESGLKPGEQVAASGSFKLREAALVSIANGGAASESGIR
ncbi:MAG: efflux RND transporter periplasmic adaptor subunit [Planctomycetes bacterium]|nr:efflux RND transporter periplasmic adaptor subunit [Planctomycetota bacterium]